MYQFWFNNIPLNSHEGLLEDEYLMLDENGKMVHNIKRNGKHGQNYEAVINVPT